MPTPFLLAPFRNPAFDVAGIWRDGPNESSASIGLRASFGTQHLGTAPGYEPDSIVVLSVTAVY